MPVIPGNIGRTSYAGGRAFHPAENPQQCGAVKNPKTLYGKETYSAVLIVGLQEGEGAHIKEHEDADVVKLVKKLRVKQVGGADASFLHQLGLYTHHSGEVVSEDSVRIIIIKTTPDDVETVDQFWENMLELGEALCKKFGQETVLLQHQKNGMDLATYGVMG